jgi:hypothetical protein
MAAAKTNFRATFAKLAQGLESHAKGLGIFTAGVSRHEPENDPPAGVACVIGIGAITPVRSSGLDATSFRAEFAARCYVPATKRPLDDIDPLAAGAACDLMASLSADFTLGGLVREIDLLGSEGNAMQAQPGWLEQSGKKFRTADVIIPLIINDAFSQQEA